MTGGRDLYRICENHDDEIIENKEVIKQRLFNDTDIIKVLNNKNLPLDEPDAYAGKNILPWLYNPDVTYEVSNMIFFDVEDIGEYEYNNAQKIKQVTFMIVVDKQDLETEYGHARHDLLGYLVRDLFNWSNCLGTQIKLLSNRVYVLQNGYYVREQKYRSMTPNSLGSAHSQAGMALRSGGMVNAYD